MPDVTPLKTPPAPKGEFELVPAGVYLARCFKMIDLGTQKTEFKGVAKDVRKILLYWELLRDDDGEAIFMADGERVFTINKEYTWSMDPKANLRKDLDSWRGTPFTDAEADGFEITKLLGVFCKLQVIHKKSKDGQKTYANVGSLMTSKITDGGGANDLTSFSITEPNMVVFENLPDWLKDKIRAAAEWKVEGAEVQNGKITPEGDIEIEDLGDGEAPISKDDLAKLPF